MDPDAKDLLRKILEMVSCMEDIVDELLEETRELKEDLIIACMLAQDGTGEKD